MNTSDTPLTKTPSSPPQQQEPDPKKLKMSSTTTTSDDDAATRKQKYKRRKIAIFFAYCVVGYQGMQKKKPGAKTIEGELEEALFHSGAVPEQDRGYPKRYDWARSARTDKGVSAVGQVVSGRFYIDPTGLVERLNRILPTQFRIFGYKRVTASFNAKKFCDRRRYVYLFPVFALDPSCHRDRESVMASLGSGMELVKCLECSDRGRKVIGVMGKRSFEPKSSMVQSGVSSNNEDADNAIKEDSLISELKEEVIEMAGSGVVADKVNVSKSTIVPCGISSNIGDTEKAIKKDNQTSELKNDSGVVEDEDKVEKKPIEERRFCYGEKEKERFNRILNHYVGSHNFHNFTTRTKPEDPAARRSFLSFHANTVVTV